MNNRGTMIDINLKESIRKLLHQVGFDIRNYTISNYGITKKILDYHQINLVLDVGANKGQYYNFLRTVGYSGKIISFEPLSEAHSYLEKISKKDPLWEIAPRTAIGNEEGEISINIAGNSASSSLLPMLDRHRNAAPESAYIGSETVKITRLDSICPSYINQDSQIFLKIDVQGYEQKVLEGAKGILSQVKGIQLEVSFVPLYEGELLFRDMLNYMDHLGYSLAYLNPGLFDSNTVQLLQADAIFCSP